MSKEKVSNNVKNNEKAEATVLVTHENSKVNKAKGFVKRHWKKVAMGVGAVALTALGVVAGTKLGGNNDDDEISLKEEVDVTEDVNIE